MKIVMAGGSGHVGSGLRRRFVEQGHEVVVLSRRPGRTSDRTVVWDGVGPGSWTEEIEGADVLVNLAGRSVDCRYHAANRREILASRLRSTAALGSAIAAATHPPRVWLQSSTATIYSHRYDAANDEPHGVLGGLEPGVPDTWRFSVDVAKLWEGAATASSLPSTRLVLLRSAMVMSQEPGSVFDVLLGLVRRGLGGRNGDGRQFVSWIHESDFGAALDWILGDDTLSGPVNVASPNPLPNSDFMAALRQAAGVKFGLASSRWMLEVGAFVARTETELVLKSRRVIPTRLLASGFRFQFPEWAVAAADLYERWRARRATPA